jgi:hypothetical protein
LHLGRAATLRPAPSDFNIEGVVRIATIVLAALGAAGCYYYSPLNNDPQPEMSLSVTLTDSGTDHLSRYLGPDVESLRGRLLSVDDTTYAMSVSAVDLRHGMTLGWKGERVALNRSLVATMSERRFSAGRTALTSTLTMAGFYLTVQAFKILGGGSRMGSGGGGPPR